MFRHIRSGVVEYIAMADTVTLAFITQSREGTNERWTCLGGNNFYSDPKYYGFNRVCGEYGKSRTFAIKMRDMTYFLFSYPFSKRKNALPLFPDNNGGTLLNA